MVKDELSRHRYEREVERTNSTADKVIGDAREAHQQDYLTSEGYARILAAVVEYRQSMLRLLADLYEVEGE
jgi:hypothetical protein